MDPLVQYRNEASADYGPSEMVADQPTFARIMGCLGAALTMFGGFALALKAIDLGIEGFGIGPSRDYSMFPCWNHWPVAQMPSDGRYAKHPDRTSHSSLTSPMVK